LDDQTRERLLSRFQPYLRYDSCEGFFADSAAEWTDNPSNVLRRAHPAGGGEPEIIASAKPGGAPHHLSLGFLADYQYEPGDHISDRRDDYRTQYVELRKDRRYRNRIYGRIALGEEGPAWLQYWFFYFYNDYRMAGGIGLHEGDWEMVQLRMPSRDPSPRDVPEEAVYAQHKHAQRAGWDEVEKLPGSDRPVVYAGRGSHASYFESGIHETEVWIDIADGQQEPSELQLEIVPDEPPGWLRWPGQWGDTEPNRWWLARKIEQPSPVGPCEHDQWSEPELLLRDSVEPKVRQPKRHHQLEARRDGCHLVVDFDFSVRVADEPHKLVVRVNSEDEPDICPRVFTFTLDEALRGTLETRIELSPDRRYDVHLGTIDARGEPSASVFGFLGGKSPEDPPVQRGLRRLGSALFRLFGGGRG
jgi:hypothetical protein